MITKLKKFSLVVCVFVLTGCTSLNQQQAMQANQESVVVETPVPTATTTPKSQYGIKKKIPLTADGVQCGTITVTQIEKVGINDINNEKAMNNSVNYSYSINITVRFKSTYNEITNFTCVPKIYNGRKLASSPACVGWTGFKTVTSVYGGSGSATIETNQMLFFCHKIRNKIVLYFPP